MKNRADLKAVILGMNYGELLAIASDFAAMKDKEVRPQIETKEEFAALLFDWAEAQD